MEEYKTESFIAALFAGIGILWNQLIKQIKTNRDDQKEFGKLLARNIEVISECNELMRDFKNKDKHG